MDLFGLLKTREWEPLDVSEVRVVARDLLVALNALKNAGVTHADIKPDNIVLVNHQSQPFRVKLIDFGVAMETHKLWRYDTIQVCGFRAPEVNLGLPLTEAVDMWAVACTLAYIFLGDHVHNTICEFNNMRQIFKLHGLPDQDLLGKGTKVDRFFIFDQSNQTWRFKTPQEYTETIIIDGDHHDIALDSIDDFLTINPEIQDPFELEDLQAFVDLLKKMFTVNPSERITPEEALNHRFITMSHLPPTSNNSYVISAYEKMKTADNKSNLFDLNLSDYDLSDSDLCELEDSNSDLSDLDTDEPVNTSELDVDKFQKADLSNFKQYDSELEAR
uniref:Protein kinase domain-containing protein n=1 Tax=Nothobranchius rachovii TaxID=451742 RepID=A0A1A8PUI9_9TELE